MFFKLKSYLSFLLKSTNQHGVHSPFVYDLTTQCFYAKTPKSTATSGKKLALLLRLEAYLQPNSMLEVTSASKTNLLAPLFDNKKNKITTLNNSSLDTNSTLKEVDFVFFNSNKTQEIIDTCFDSFLKIAHNNTVFVFNNIHTNMEMEKAWSTIKKHPKITVTIDTYQLGLVFFRKEQEKEHFIIRV
ncbi:MAG: hypothetical protein P8K77_03305 [Polaribacter sp.]|nr:hypothetical protein [Polaribacter sp.]